MKIEIVLLGVIIATFLFSFLVCCFVLSAKELEEEIGILDMKKKEGIEQMDVAEKSDTFASKKDCHRNSLEKEPVSMNNPSGNMNWG